MSKNTTNNSDSFAIRNEATVFELAKTGLSLKVYVSSSPKESSIERFVEFMIEDRITDVFNFCHPKPSETPYDCNLLSQRDIRIHHLWIADGAAPDSELLAHFDELIDDVVLKAKENDEIGTILFHCEAGLGRAPTMLAYLMMSRFGWRSRRLDLITHIRSKRRNALNHAQLNWIQNARIRKVGSNPQCGCIIV